MVSTQWSVVAYMWLGVADAVVTWFLCRTLRNITVAAVAHSGQGPVSLALDEVNTVVQGVPPAPSKLRIGDGVTSTTIPLEWSAPHQHDTPIDHYLVRYTVVGPPDEDDDGSRQPIFMLVKTPSNVPRFVIGSECVLSMCACVACVVLVSRLLACVAVCVAVSVVSQSGAPCLVSPCTRHGGKEHQHRVCQRQRPFTVQCRHQGGVDDTTGAATGTHPMPGDTSRPAHSAHRVAAAEPT